VRGWKLLCLGPVVAALLAAPPRAALAATVAIDGSQTYQTIDGFGVNANYWSWGHDLEPVLDALINEAGMTLFRVVFNEGWEAVNDNADSSVMNWDYYNSVYGGTEVQKLWGLMAALNQRGITNGVMPNFQGYGPDWMVTSTSAVLPTA
jgi:hypothetical protein